MATNQQRAHHNKSRTGCKTCRSRRVKCDEAKPACYRCVRVGRSCEGYEPLRTWYFEPNPTTRSLSSTSRAGCDPEEQRALQFFQEQTTPILAAFSKFTQRFWDCFMQQMSHSETSVRYMAIALATRQEAASCAPSDLYSLSRVRSKAFSSALKLLTQPQPQVSTLAVLMCCLLFVGYEAFQDPLEMDTASVSHLGAGLRILEDRATLRAFPSTDSYAEAIHTYLEPMYFQLEMMVCLFRTPIMTTQSPKFVKADLDKPKLPSHFQNLITARISFYKICRWHFAFRAEGNKAWTPKSSTFLTVRALFLEWHKLIMLYNDSLSASDVVQRQGLITMVSHWRLLMVSLVHSTATSSSAGSGKGSPYLPNGGRLKTSLVDLSEKESVKITFIVDERTLLMLQICDWTDSGLLCDPALRIWPIAQVRPLEDGRGLVRLIMLA